MAHLSFLQNLYKNTFIRLFTIIFFLFIFIIISTINKPTIAQSINTECKNSLIKNSCYTKRILSFQKDHTFKEAYTLLHSLQKIDSSLNYCHPIGHAMARMEVSKDPSNWAQLLKEINVRDCADGFFHGTIEAHISFNPTYTLNEKTILDLCNKVGNITDDEKNLVWNTTQICVHTIGHLVLLQEKGAINQAIGICNNISKNDLVEKCVTGIFMEYIEGSNLESHGYRKPLVWSTQLFQQMETLCNSFHDYASSPSCWAQLSKQYVKYISKDNMNELYSYCQKAQSPHSTFVCYTNGAIYTGIMAMINKYPISTINQLCNPVKDNSEQYISCIKLITQYITAGTTNSQSKIISFCTNITETYKNVCYESLSDIFKERLSKEAHLQLCKQFPKNYQDKCKKNA